MVRVRVPATTANLGPGFDCLGLALGLYNTIEIEEAGTGPQIEIDGEGANELPTDETNLAYRAVQSLFEYVGYQSNGLTMGLENRIPLEGGLGSSAATVVGGLIAAEELIGSDLSQEELLRLAVKLEGHPDNVAPALLGGLVVISAMDGDFLYTHVDVPSLRVVIATPDLRVPTVKARRLLPDQVAFTDAAFNLSRTALVVLALERGDFKLLGPAMRDRLHQPYRGQLIPGFEDVVAGARKAGAASVAISGAGPSVVAFAESDHEEIGQAMTEAFAKQDASARTFVLDVDAAGVQIEED